MSTTAAMDPRRRPPMVNFQDALTRRLLIVSNRLPYRVQTTSDKVELERTTGGLVTALDPVTRQVGGTWIGWSGAQQPPSSSRLRVEPDRDADSEYWLRMVHLDRDDLKDYYLGYSNRVLWPLFHYFQEHCEVDAQQWDRYRKVNRRFARAVVEEYQEGDLIWVHDYHLMLVPDLVRRRLPDARIAFFLHIPFPAKEIYLIQPDATRLLEGLLGADLIGFHTAGYARNFLSVAAELTDWPLSSDPMSIQVGERRVGVGNFPISIDSQRFSEIAEMPETQTRVDKIRQDYRAEFIAIGVDRLDYTKGILERLQAVEIMLESHPELQGRFTFIQISAPSRSAVDTYQEMRDEIERMVGRINGRFGAHDCVPVDYRYQSFSREQLVAYYRAADVAMVTPLRDGMNLVAKEYVASRSDGDGCLVLSRFAGSASELSTAVIVNPYDPTSTARALHRALTMPVKQRRGRMKELRAVVLHHDIHHWLETFLARAG